MTSFKTTFGWSMMTLAFLICFIVLLLIPNKLYWLIGLFGGLVIIGTIAIITTKSQIIINEDEKTIKLIISPLIDPASCKEKRHRIDEWNNHVNLLEIKSYQIRKVSKEEKEKFLGSKFVSNNYLIIELKKGSLKYINISQFSKKQIAFIKDKIDALLNLFN